MRAMEQERKLDTINRGQCLEAGADVQKGDHRVTFHRSKATNRGDAVGEPQLGTAIVVLLPPVRQAKHEQGNLEGETKPTWQETTDAASDGYYF